MSKLPINHPEISISYAPTHNSVGIDPSTWIMTHNGPQRAEQLVNSTFRPYVHTAQVSTTGFFPVTNAATHLICTEGGPQLRASASQQVLVFANWVGHGHAIRTWTMRTKWRTVSSLRAGDKLVLQRHKNINWEGLGGTFDLGWLMGELVGDGNLFGTEANFDFWGDDREFMFARVQKLLFDNFQETRVVWRNEALNRGRISSFRAFAYAVNLGLSPNAKNISDKLECMSSDFIRGFLSGWFDADGSVQGTLQKGISIRLASVHLRNIQSAQRMLLRLGINSKLYVNRAPNRTHCLLPDGHGGKKWYKVQKFHELIISGANLRVFYERIPLHEPAKQSRLIASLSAYRRKLNADEFLATVSKVSRVAKLSTPAVTCIVPDIGAFSANAFYVRDGSP